MLNNLCSNHWVVSGKSVSSITISVDVFGISVDVKVVSSKPIVVVTTVVSSTDGVGVKNSDSLDFISIGSTKTKSISFSSKLKIIFHGLTENIMN